MKNLNNLLQHLLDNNIEFVLIGGYAGVVHGSTQVTRDLDICALVTPIEITKLREALKSLNPRHRMNPTHKPSFLTEPKDISRLENIYLETELGILDVIGSVVGVGDFYEVLKNSVKIEIFGRQCNVISVEALIRAKELMGRVKDKAVVAELKAIKAAQPV